MRILVIGGTRFIGLHLIPKLIAAGHHPVLFNRGSSPLPWNRDQVSQILGDRNDYADFAAKVKDQEFDAVIDMIMYNREQAEALISAFSAKKPHLIMLSTRGVYADPTNSPCYEDDLLIADSGYAYGYNKAEAEIALHLAYKENGFPMTILRLPAIYGEYDYQIRERYFIKRILDGRTRILLPEGGAGVNQREYAGNVAAQIVFMLEYPRSIGHSINVGHAKIQTYRSIVTDAMAITGHQMEIYSIPAPLHPAIPVLARPVVTTLSIAKLQSLGWQEEFTPYQGLANTIAWLKGEADEILPSHVNKAEHFDYEAEDRLILSHGIKIN